MGNQVPTSLNYDKISQSTIQAANATLYGTKAAVNRTVAALSDTRVAEAVKPTVNVIASTGSSAIQGAGYTLMGTAITTAGAIQGNDELYKQGIGTLNDAKDKLLDAIVGRAKLSASISADISTPYEIKFNPMDVNATVLKGVIGMALIQPTLMMLKSSIKENARRETEKLFKMVNKIARKQIRRIGLNDDSIINIIMQDAWKPQYLKAKFQGHDKLLISLDSDAVKVLSDKVGISVKQSSMSHILVLNQKLNVSIEADTGNGLFCVTIFGIDDILEMIKCQILKGAIIAVGDLCYDCDVSIVPSNGTISVGVDVFVKVPL